MPNRFQAPPVAAAALRPSTPTTPDPEEALLDAKVSSGSSGGSGRQRGPLSPQQSPRFRRLSRLLGLREFKPIYQNTYRLESKRPWVEELILATIKEVMHEHLEGVEYEAAKCAELAVTVANEIRCRVRNLNFERYKIACIVDIYEKLFQGVHTEAGFLWDKKRDHYTTYNFSNTHLTATGTVFGIYFE